MEKIDWSKYKFRASGVSNIMTGSAGITEVQKKKIQTLTDKEKLTDLQAKELKDLKYKRDNITLSSGAKTYIKKLFREEKYNRRAELSSKYIDKGNANEEDSITMVSLIDDYAYENNKERVYNDFIQGEADIKPVNKKGMDVKSSWSLASFPFDDDTLPSNYYWQDMSYIDLYNADEWETIYCLTNLNDFMINDMIYKAGFKLGETPMWKKLEILNLHVYDEENFFRLMDLHDCKPTVDSDEKSIDIVNNFVTMTTEERVIRKLVKRDDKKIKEIYTMVKLGRIELQRLEDNS